MTVDKLAKDSQYQRLIQLVKQADSTPAHFVRMADRYAVPFYWDRLCDRWDRLVCF